MIWRKCRIQVLNRFISMQLEFRANNAALLLSNFQVHRHIKAIRVVTYSYARRPAPVHTRYTNRIVSTQRTTEAYETSHNPRSLPAAAAAAAWSASCTRQIRPLVCRIQYIRRTVAAASLAASLHVRSADELIYGASLRSIPSRRQSTELASNALAPRTS